MKRLQGQISPMWMLQRHGTRYCDTREMRKFHKLLGFRDTIVKNHERGDGKLCSSDIEKFRLWRLDPGMTEAASDNLVPQGYIELRSIAQRLGHAFPELLHVPHYDEKEFLFRATNRQRTQASMQSFYGGIFNSSTYPFDDPQSYNEDRSTPKDLILLAHKNCPAWTASTIARKNTECDQFTQGPEMQILFREILNRNAMHLLLFLPADEIKLMYDMCRYESAWYPARESIWCIPFNRTELEILEFRQDLDYYYFAGPGRDLSSKMGCKTLADMFEHFRRLEDKKSSTSQVKGVFYFAHTLTIQHLLSAMGIGVDSPPVTAKDYPSTNRNYRTSLNGPFATNINAVFYRCNDNTSSTNQVMFHVAERPLKISGCNANGMTKNNLLRNVGNNNPPFMENYLIMIGLFVFQLLQLF
ncbi:hypothetical protein TKK_0015945 [Trichogramma kaykai]